MTNLIQELVQENSKMYKSDLFKMLVNYVQSIDYVSDGDKEMFNRMEGLYYAMEDLEVSKDKKTMAEDKVGHDESYLNVVIERLDNVSQNKCL